MGPSGGEVMVGFAEFIIGPARGRTRWLNPPYELVPCIHFLKKQKSSMLAAQSASGHGAPLRPKRANV